MDTRLIFNPAARGQRAAQLRQHLASLSSQCDLKPTMAQGHGRALARETVGDGFKTIVVAGGDGTLNEVLNGIGDAPNGFAAVRLGVLPVGTVNVFAKDLGLPTRIQAAWQVVQRGREMAMDVPYAEFDHAGHRKRRYFAQLAGAGLDARAIALVDWKQKKRWGALAYVLAGCRALAERKPKIIASSATAGGRGELVLVGNGRYYGGKFPFFPQASRQDGLLDIVVYPRANWASALEVAWGWITKRLDRAAGAITFQTSAVTLTGPSEMAVQMDGENVGCLPATFGVLPKALRVLVP